MASWQLCHLPQSQLFNIPKSGIFFKSFSESLMWETLKDGCRFLTRAVSIGFRPFLWKDYPDDGTILGLTTPTTTGPAIIIKYDWGWLILKLGFYRPTIVILNGTLSFAVCRHDLTLKLSKECLFDKRSWLVATAKFVVFPDVSKSYSLIYKLDTSHVTQTVTPLIITMSQWASSVRILTLYYIHNLR